MANETLEDRVAALEAEVAHVKSQMTTVPAVAPKKRGWRRLVGIDANNPYFEAAVQAGRAWRNTEPLTAQDEEAA